MRILVAESCPIHAGRLRSIFRALDFAHDIVDVSDDAVSLARRSEYDAILVGDTIPGGVVRTVRKLRAARISAPVLIASVSARVEHKVAAFDAGADDYLLWPYHRDELVSRLRALVRRSRGFHSATIEIGEVIVDRSSKRAFCQGKDVRLTGKEYQVLELLALRRGVCVTKDTLMNHLYNGPDEPESKIIDIYMCKLRKKLPPGLIETIWGRGYTLAEGIAAPVM